MNLIVATYYRILICNEAGEIQWELREEKTGHYGITWNEDNMFVLCANPRRKDGRDQWIGVLDKELNYVDRILAGKDRIIGTHQIQWWDNRLWICSSADGHIVVCDEKGKVERVWAPYAHFPLPQCHINSIWFEPELVHLVHHTYGKEPSIFTYTYPGLEFVERTGLSSVPHNVYRYRGNLMSLLIGGIHIVGGGVNTPGYYAHKGLAVSKTAIIFGAAVVQDRPSRHKEREGHLYRYTPDFRPVSSVNLRRGPINEIRILDRADDAHHGRPWSGEWGV